MSSACCSSPDPGGTTLSSRILSALHQRGKDEAMFVLLASASPRDSSPTRTDCQLDGAEVVITKDDWCTFAFLLHQHLSGTPLGGASCDEEPQSTIDTSATSTDLHVRCDVGVYCSETFYACLAESVCLFMGLSFCVFRPDDPVMRMARLEQRRRPRHKLYQQDIMRLLQSALNETTGGGDDGTAESVTPSSRAAISLRGLAAPQEIPDTCIAYFMHTSGSTGDPKCVVASRGNLHAYLRQFIYSRDGLTVTQQPPCRFFCLSSPFFDPSIGDMLATLCTPRSTFYTCSQSSLLNGSVGALMALAHPTHVVSTPAVWRTVCAEALRPSVRGVGGSMRPMKVFLGGERMPQSVIEEWAGEEVELFNIYGVTEATIYQSVRRVPAGTSASEVTCGTGVGTRIVIDVDASPSRGEGDDGTLGDGDGFGEVVLYGDQVCCGYADEAAGSTATSPFGFDPVSHTRFFRTGDVGRLVPSLAGNEEPQLVLRGRRDWQIKVNGQRVSMEEVEGTVQRAMEGVFTQCACFCVRNGDGASGLSAPAIGAAAVFADVPSAQRLELHASGVAEALQAVLALHLPPFMVPRRWLLHACGASLPQTATGKVDRTELARRARADTQATLDADVSEVDATARDVLYTTVQSVWEVHLGMPVHADTHYLHAGGDSLGALKITRAVYLRLHGGDDGGIDEFGGLPSPFQPCVLLQHPRFGDYVAVLRQAGLDGASVEHASAAPPTGGVTTPPDSSSGMDGPFRAVVAAHAYRLAELLLRHGLVDVNGGHTRDHRCVTPLHLVVSSAGDSDAAEVAAALRTMQVLLDFGAKPTAITPDGVTPAHLAAAVSAPLLQRLLDNAPSLLHYREDRQQSLLHFAARSGNVAAVQLLLWTYELKLDTRDKWQRTPVHWAVLNGHLDALEAMNAYYRASQTSPPLRANEMSTEALDGTTEKVNKRHQRTRRPGCETARFTRLARKKTFLAYETLCAIAQRTNPDNERMRELCCALSTAVGEEPTPQ